MKKLFAVLLSLVLVIGLFSGCSGDRDDTSAGPSESAGADATPTPEQKAAIDAYPDRDLNGYEYVVRAYDGSLFIPNDDGTPLSVARLERNKIIEEKFNCKIVFQEGAYGTHFQDAQPAVLAGEKWGDIIGPTMWMNAFFIAADFLLDLNTVSTLNLSAEYYTQQLVKASTINGRTLELAGDLNSVLNYTWGVYFNKRLIDELGLDNPYELVRNNQWTWDKFVEMVIAGTKDLNGDGIMDQSDLFGLSGPRDDIDNAAFTSSGLPFYGEQDGKVVLVINNAKTVDVINKIEPVFREGVYFYPKTPAGSWGEYRTGFVTGHSLFHMYHMGAPSGSGGGDPLVNMEDDWGLVPMPKYEASQTTYAGWVDHNAMVISMLQTNPDPEVTGLITDALFAVSRELCTPAFMSQYTNLYFRDDDSAEMLELINQGPYFDIAFLVRQAKGEVGWPVQWAIGGFKGNDFAAAVESQESAVLEAVNTLFNQQ